MSDSEPKFEPGDVVRHKASHEQGVVVDVSEGMTNRYEISVGIGENHSLVPEYQLEKVSMAQRV